jgi:hypothetical protein
MVKHLWENVMKKYERQEWLSFWTIWVTKMTLKGPLASTIRMVRIDPWQSADNMSNKRR